MTTSGSRARTDNTCELDTSAAATRSMLGWGVVAGPVYLGTGLALAASRDGFDLTEHALSLLMLGDGGWMQRTNLLLSGLLCLIAAVGIRRALAYGSVPNRTGALVIVFGLGLLGSGTFAPDPMRGFPADMADEVTASGILHMSFGLVQFLSLTAAGFALSRWSAHRGDRDQSIRSRTLALTVLLGFLGGAALGQHTIGIALLWLAVLAAYAWIATTCLYLWHLVPHPDRIRR